MKTKINYGIYVNSTSVCIARMEDDGPLIINSNTLKKTIPLCVGVNKKGMLLVGDSAFNTYRSNQLRRAFSWLSSTDIFIGFWRTIGTIQTYYSLNLDKTFTSEELLAEVLKKIRTFVVDDEPTSVVLTYPVKFDINQKRGLVYAGNLAGFTQVELLQEPIAASMVYGLNSQNKNGYWVVFDFGGGTFDAALVKVEDGIMQVKDTDGDNYLGGRNLDAAIVDEIIIPYLEEEYVIDSILKDNNKKQILQDAMKYYAEEAKIQLSFKEEHNILSDLGDIPGEDDEGEKFKLDITINRKRLKEAIAPIFQRAIDITKDLIQRNNLSGGKLDALVLVGGPTYSPILREMLEEQIKKPDTSADPMTAVATGAALYASTIDVSDEVKEASRDQTKIQLDIGYEPSTVELEEFVTLKILPEKTEGAIPASVFVEIVRGDKAWSSGKVSINEKGEMIEAKLNEGKPNNFQILLYDGAGNKLGCQPDNFTIIQGSKVGSATLPYNIGVEIKRGRDGKLVFRTAKGLEVNQPLPAKGIINGLKTQKQIRPGNAQDTIEIPIYQGDYYSEGTRALYNEHVYNAKITGDDLPALLPERSDFNLTLITDKSGIIEKIEAFFPHLDHTVDIEIPETVGSEIDAAFLDKEIRKAKRALSGLAAQGLVNRQEIESTAEEIERLKQSLDQSRNDYDRKKEVLDDLKKSLRKIDELEGNIEWVQFEKELREEFDRLEGANEELGNEKTTQHVNQLKTQVDEVIRKKDLELGQTLISEIKDCYHACSLKQLKPEYLKGLLIEIYSEHPEIPPQKFKALFDKLSEFQDNQPIVETVLSRLEDILNEINNLT
ncbi:Hsp70 family protein [Phaeodactylibacter xiamenensis]|uniref:Hsp70 family protein n=1 Tax=Phaeodactylibacter xiamenensis TaxID=1524460 RepID=UPI003CCBFECA